MSGTPERLGGNPRENVEDAYATFMDMSEDELNGLVTSLVQGGRLTPVENEGLQRALKEKGAERREQIVPVGIATEESGTAVEGFTNTAAIVPLLGIVVNLENPSEVAVAMQAVRAAKRQLDDVRADLERILVEEAARQGTKTLHLDKAEVVISGGPTVEYDAEELLKLRDAGLPVERYDALVKARIEYVVDKRVIAQLRGSGNPEYNRIIDNAAQEVERPYRVSVK